MPLVRHSAFKGSSGSSSSPVDARSKEGVSSPSPNHGMMATTPHAAESSGRARPSPPLYRKSLSRSSDSAESSVSSLFSSVSQASQISKISSLLNFGSSKPSSSTGSSNDDYAVDKYQQTMPEPRQRKTSVTGFFSRSKVNASASLGAISAFSPGRHSSNPPPKNHYPTSAPPTVDSEQVHNIREKAFGTNKDPRYRAISKYPDHAGPLKAPNWDEAPYWVLLSTYLSYLVLIAFGHTRDFWGKRFRKETFAHLVEKDGFAPLNNDFEDFYVRRLKIRLNDCFNRPITGVPGRIVTLLDRDSKDYCLHFSYTGTTTEALNLSSYNYLGFAQAEGRCADAVQETVSKYGMSSAGPRMEAGSTDLHREVEALVAQFVGKEDAMVISMGFATNSTTLPALCSKGCLIISDELNHASIRFGARLSGAMIRMFKHNDMQDLERLLKDVISQGQPRTHRPWKKILIVVEGLYSMEGTLVNLPGLVELKEKYKFFLYVDEAHSIGALGPRGRGVCDYYGVDPKHIDILMGTFTKSFGASGGYLSASRAIISHLRLLNHGQLYAESISPVVLQQIRSSMLQIMGPEVGIMDGVGEERLRRLAFNARYLSTGLKKLGFIVYGHRDSPVIPVLLYQPAKMPLFSREMLKRNVAVVVVGYPATGLVESRTRLCVSAAHTKEDIDYVLRACSEVGDLLMLKYTSRRVNIEDVIRDTPREVIQM